MALRIDKREWRIIGGRAENVALATHHSGSKRGIEVIALSNFPSEQFAHGTVLFALGVQALGDAHGYVLRVGHDVAIVEQQEAAGVADSADVLEGDFRLDGVFPLVAK